jgi:hypothetical protein
MEGESEKPQLPAQNSADELTHGSPTEISSCDTEPGASEKPATNAEPSLPPEPISPPFPGTDSTPQPDPHHASITQPTFGPEEKIEPVDSGFSDEPLPPQPLERPAYPILSHPIHVPADDPVWGDSPKEFWDEVQRGVHEIHQMTSEEENLRVKKCAGEVRSALLEKRPTLLAFDHFRNSHSDKFVCIEECSEDTVWFIGDLHGDLLSLLALQNYITNFEARGKNTKFIICLLGDIIDDGILDNSLLFHVLVLIANFPDRYAFVVGNHDEGLYREPESGDYRSSVSPSDFCDRLNSKPPSSQFRDLADTAIDFFSKAPRALLLPDGLLVAHGGVPHTDLLATLKTLEDFNRPAALTDFVWTRLHERAKRKIPNRSTRGCSLGIEDFDAFCKHASNVLGRPVRAMIRGHDHIGERFLVHEHYKNHPVVTINAMSYKQRDVFGPFERKPVVARWRMGKPLEIHQIEIPSELIAHFYKPDAEGEKSLEGSPEAPE